MLVPIPSKVFLLDFKHHFFFFLMTTLAPSTLLRFRFETQKNFDAFRPLHPN